MSGRWRILLVATHAPPRGARLASTVRPGLPARDVALMAARLLHAGADVRVLDQDSEGLAGRIVRREAQRWRADLVLLHAGGSAVEDDPVPDARPLARLLAGWGWRAPRLACGPLARLYGRELVERLPQLSGALLGEVHPALVGAWRPADVPGLVLRDGAAAGGPPPSAAGDDATHDCLPAWHVLLLEALGVDASDGLREVDVLATPGDAARTLAEVRHAVHRAGARRLSFADRDFGAEPDLAQEVARGMLAAAPGLPWNCRVRADHLDARLALALANGGCTSVLVVAPGGRHAPGLMPMDDPARPRLESAVEAARVIGLRAAVEHVIGRPGHSPEMLDAWRRWFRDRRILVRPRVRVLHAGDRGAGEPRLAEALARAGCWDNALRPRDVERAVREVGERALLAQGDGP
jgi:hypothetical protein